MEERTFRPFPGRAEVYPKDSIYGAIYKHFGDPHPDGETFWTVWFDTNAGVEPRISLEESYHSLWDISNFEANEIEFDPKAHMVDGIYSKTLEKVGKSYESSIFLTRPNLSKKLRDGIYHRLHGRKEAQPRVPKSEVKMTEKHATAIKLLPKTGEGIASTGAWGGMAPKRGKERTELRAKCGEGCFLRPQDNGYPICPKLGVGHDCEVSCQGLAAANARSRFLPDEFRGKDGIIQKIQREKGCRK